MSIVWTEENEGIPSGEYRRQELRKSVKICTEEAMDRQFHGCQNLSEGFTESISL